MENDPVRNPPADPLLRVQGLKKHFLGRRNYPGGPRKVTRAVDGIDLEIYPGETLGLVGESGCGKSTIGRTILRLLEPTEGTVEFKGRDLSLMSDGQLRRVRREMQIVFQDPFSSLNPRMTVGSILQEPLRIHRIGSPAEQKNRVRALLQMVGLSPEFAGRYPHEFSGGQRQRVGIARALATEPSFIVADEPISALDVSIQAQIVNLLRDLKEELGLTYLFIAHDLSMIRHISDRVAVMYLGRIVELGSRDAIFENPQHPYTRALLSSVPVPDPSVRVDRLEHTAPTEPPDPASPPPGCHFHPRCPHAREECLVRAPQLETLQLQLGATQQVACHFAGDLSH